MRPTSLSARRRHAAACLAVALAAGSACRGAAPPAGDEDAAAARPGARRLPTGARLDPAAPSTALGSMPLSIAVAPGGRYAAVLLGGWREQGLQVVDRASGRVVRTLPQASAFMGLAFSPDGRTLYASGGNQDVVYRYAWNDGAPALRDSVVLAPKEPKKPGTRYPAGLALSPDGAVLYVAENLADSLAVVDLASGRVVARHATERYPVAVAVAPDGAVYVSAWGGNTVSAFRPGGAAVEGGGAAAGAAPLVEVGRIAAGRHPSALLLNGDGSRLFVASGSTDRVAVVDTRSRRVVATLSDAPPGARGAAGPGEGSTPNALALAADGARLFVAEADNNAVAVFDLSAATAGTAAAAGRDSLAGRVPVEWYPTALAVSGDTLLVVNGKGGGTAPNADGPSPGRGTPAGSRAFTLGQTTGSLTSLPLSRLDGALAGLTARVARANHWDGPATGDGAGRYPPFEHVVYVIKENRTYDQVFGDLPAGDGDTSLVFFPRAVSPNHHALAERFGLFDRFFVNAEVSADGHNWTTAAYATDYVEKTVPSNYSGRGRTYDYEGTNRGHDAGHVDAEDAEDASEPANGYLWDLAERAGISFRNYGEFVVREGTGDGARYVGDKPFLRRTTNPRFPGFDLGIPDQRRADVWLADLAADARAGTMPALEIVRLPNDHTAGRSPGQCTPRACMADNDLALGRMVEALSRSPFWKSTVVFVVEDDAQNGPDHVDSHRAPFLAISAYGRPGVSHRWANTTDVIATIAEILKLGHLSQFDYYGRPLRDAFADAPDLAPYTALVPAVDLAERNPPRGVGAVESRALDLSREDRADDELFNRVLWRAIKGDGVPYPGPTRMSALEWRRSR